MDIQEVKTLVDNFGKTFEELKATQAEAFKKHDALTEEKLSKMQADLLAQAEISQKANAEALAKLQRPALGSDAEEKAVAAGLSKEFNTFLKMDNAEKQHFAAHLAKSGKADEFKALAVNINQDGGFLVLPAFGGVVDVRVFESSPVRQLANVVPIAGDRYEIVLDNDEAGAGWVGEIESRTETTAPTVDQKIINMHEIYAKPKATQKSLDMMIVNAEAWLASKVSDKFSRLEAAAFLSGDGVKKPVGILTNTTSSTSYSAGAVQTINSGSSGAFTYNGLVDIQNALKERYQANATWMMKRASFGAIMKIKSGITDDNTPIFNMMYDKNTGLPGFSLLSRPVVFADDVEAVGSAGKAAIYGDFRAGYTVIDGAGVRVLRDPYSSHGYVTFYTTKRVGGDVVNAEALKVQVLS